MALVDANVLLDIATNDPKWAIWSLRQVDAAFVRGPVLINAVICAEFSVAYALEEIDKVLTGAGLNRAAYFRLGHRQDRGRALAAAVSGGGQKIEMPDAWA